MRKHLSLIILTMIAIISASIWVREGYRPSTIGAIVSFVYSASTIITIIAYDSQSKN